MSFVCFVVFILLIAAVVIPLSIANSKATNEAWSKAARTLGLAHRPGVWPSSPAISGIYQGFAVHVDTFVQRSGKHSRSYTRFKVQFPRSLGLDLNLTRAGFLSGVAQFFGSQDIEVGDQAFDNQTIIKGMSPQRVMEFLTPSRRMRISRFLDAYTEATISDASVDWVSQGVIRDPARLTTHVKALVRLAWHVVEDRPEDQKLAEAIVAQDDGRPEEALRMLAEGRLARGPGKTGIDAFKPAPVEERLLEGQLLYLSGRPKEAERVFAEAVEETPNDPELAEWAQALAGKPEEPPIVAEAVPESQPATAPPTGELDAGTVCDALFASGGSSFAANQIYEERFAGKSVQWSGVLERVDEFSYDLVFHGHEGCKAIVKVHELSATGYGQRRVLAVVQFPKQMYAELRNRIGQPLHFSGTLAKVDGLLRNIYIIDGRAISGA